MQTLVEHAPFGNKLDAGAMVASLADLEARLEVG
jgi:hypothetical protein